jgi:hypothetical protein
MTLKYNVSIILEFVFVRIAFHSYPVQLKTRKEPILGICWFSKVGQWLIFQTIQLLNCWTLSITLFFYLKHNVSKTLLSPSSGKRLLIWAQSIKLVFVSGYQYQSQNQSQGYFTTGDLPPISLSWCQAP